MEDIRTTISNLTKKVNRQEEVIAQLIKIVAATNQRMTEMMNKESSNSESKIIN